MCGRLVNLDTVARVLAEYYHLKTETQLAALDEALSKVPAVSVGGGHGKDHVADPGKMVGDLISRQAALDIYDDYNVAVENGELEAYGKHRKRLLELPSAQPVAKDINVPAKDCISRQDAIEAMAELQGKAASKSELIGISKAWKRIKALPSASPEQTDCEYCHEDSDGYVRSIEKNSHAWLVRRGRTMKLRVGFNGGYSECDILFCPMCGRRLTYG